MSEVGSVRMQESLPCATRVTLTKNNMYQLLVCICYHLSRDHGWRAVCGHALGMWSTITSAWACGVRVPLIIIMNIMLINTCTITIT